MENTKKYLDGRRVFSVQTYHVELVCGKCKTGYFRPVAPPEPGATDIRHICSVCAREQDIPAPPWPREEKQLRQETGRTF
ncbi:hypothetical protein [Spirosoma pollinicola]|uniref:hypothetical protein n=1 Tax=Spirosoma pollinicola TaxID=2057025 RepID=UPI0012FD116C|nr:hypothetical protein [Spirosoma pollinicola]